MIHDSRYRFVKAVGMLDKIGKYTCFIYVRTFARSKLAIVS